NGQGRSAGAESMGDFSDFFESLFGGHAGGFGVEFGGPFGTGGMGGTRGGSGTRAPRPRAGADHEAEVTITLQDAIRGATRKIQLTEEGSGQTRSYDVRIPAGVTDGTVIRLSGQGGPGRNGGAAGDLLLRVSIALDRRYRIDPPGGHDLLTVVPITPSEAALGAKIDVQTPDGNVRVTVPPGSQSGQKLRIRGHGLAKRSGERGDLLAELKIVVPRELSPAERQAYETLARLSGKSPREE
ncbi:MAG: J domain-containing protein, partial [Phycisphaerales bacterium]